MYNRDHMKVCAHTKKQARAAASDRPEQKSLCHSLEPAGERGTPSDPGEEPLGSSQALKLAGGVRRGRRAGDGPLRLCRGHQHSNEEQATKS